jgi:CRP/FNR family transcriptional regulator
MDIRETLEIQLSFFTETALKDEIMEKGKLMEIPPNQVILNEGSYVKVIPILLSGLIKVVKYENGKEMLLYYIRPLESCIVSFNCSIKNEKSSVKAITESECKLLAIPAFDVENWKTNTPPSIIISLTCINLDSKES